MRKALLRRFPLCLGWRSQAVAQHVSRARPAASEFKQVLLVDKPDLQRCQQDSEKKDSFTQCKQNLLTGAAGHGDVDDKKKTKVRRQLPQKGGAHEEDVNVGAQRGRVRAVGGGEGGGRGR